MKTGTDYTVIKIATRICYPSLNAKRNLLVFNKLRNIQAEREGFEPPEV